MTSKNNDKQKNFFFDTAALVGGNAGAQFITVALTPVITRLFSPEAFGEFSVIVACAGPFVAFAGLRYHEAIMLPEKESDASSLFWLSTYLILALTLLVTIVIAFIGTDIANLLEISQAHGLIYFVPVLIFLVSIRRVLDAKLQRARQFKYLAGTSIGVAITDRTVSIGGGLLAYLSASTLVVGRALGLLSSILLMLIAKTPDKQASIGSIRAVARRYNSFAKYAWAGVIQQLDMVLPTIVLASIFGPVVAGLYALAKRVLAEPSLIVGRALSKTFYQKATELHRNNQSIAKITAELLTYLISWIVPPMVIFSFVAASSFALVFGEEWRQAGSYSVLLIPVFIASFVMQPLSRIFNILEKQKQLAMFSVLKLSFTVAALISGIYSESPEMTFTLLSVFVIFLSSSRGYWILTQVGVPRFTMMPVFIGVVVKSVLFSLPIVLVQHYFSLPEWQQILLAAMLVAIYMGWMVLNDNRLSAMLKRKKHPQ